MISCNEVVDDLTKYSILPEFLVQDEIKLAIEYFKIKQFAAGDLLSRQGDEADRAMILLDGIAHVEMDNRRIAVLKKGYIFGESAFSSDAIRKADVIAKENGFLVELTVADYELMLESHPILARHFKILFNYLLKLHKNSRDIFFHHDTTHYLALIAHNHKKQELIDFVGHHQNFFAKYPLISTDTTGTMLSEKLDIHLTRKVCSGPMGGDQEIGSLIAHGNIIAVFFFRDPLHSHAHHTDIEALDRLCDVYQVPYATNAMTAEAIMYQFEHSEELFLEHSHIKDFKNLPV